MKSQVKHNNIKKLLKEEIFNFLTEDVNYNFVFKGKKMKLRFDVNSNPTKKGIKIQFTPIENLTLHPQAARQLMTELQIHINQKLAAVGLTADFDPDVPYENVIGFTLKLGTLSNMLSKQLGSLGQEEDSIKLNSNEKQKTEIN